MPETAGQHKAGRLRQSLDEDLRALLRCDATALVIGPEKRTFAEAAAHVDETRKTKLWAELCEELARYQSHPEKEVEAASVMMAVTHVIARFIGNGELPQARVFAYLGDAWMKAHFGKREP